MPIIEGWEVSSDRNSIYEKIMGADQIGDPIITSKCKLNNDNGFLVVSDKGFAWRIKMGMRSSYMSAGKSKWIRWHDVANLIPKKNGQLLAEIKMRKGGSLNLDGRGYPKIKKWKLTIKPSKDEPTHFFKQRQAYFNNIMSDILNNNKVATDPPMSDSRM